MSAEAKLQPGISRLTTSSARMEFLPGVFGRAYAAAEVIFCNLAKKLVDGYNGGEIEYGYATAYGNERIGTIYFQAGDDLEVENLAGGPGGVISPELAGIVITSLTILRILQMICDGDISMGEDSYYRLADSRLKLLDVGRAIAAETGYTESFFNLTD